MKKVFRPFCRHRVLEIIRSHRNCAPEVGQGYAPAWVDLHRVYNFVRCSRCHKVFDTLHGERLYGEPEWAFGGRVSPTREPLLFRAQVLLEDLYREQGLPKHLREEIGGVLLDMGVKK